MLRAITGFHVDEDGSWVAELACGHGQHVRHDPPWQLREWVLSESGRRGKLGAELDCRSCELPELPADVAPYRRTATFTEEDTPEALRSDHRTKPGVWARIVVEEGKLEYVCTRGAFVLRPRVVGTVEPTLPHRVRPIGAVRFFVEFLRR